MANFGGDKYELAGIIDQNPVTTVFKAKDIGNNEIVALKILHGFVPEDGRKLLAEYRELNEVLNLVHHPRIARHITFDRWNDTFYFVEEYFRGVPLNHALQLPTWTVSMTVEVVRQACDALQYSHDLGLLHLVLKPQNILVVDAPHGASPENADEIQIRLLGLGQSLFWKPMDARNEPVDNVHYMSPEQVGILNKTTDPRSDVYSLGVLLYHALTGTLPFYGEDTVSIVHQMVARIPERPATHNPETSKALDEAVMRAIAKNPDDRFQTMEEFSAALAVVQSDLDVELAASAEAGDPGGALDGDMFPFLERDNELKRLCSQFDQAKFGRGSLVVVRGDQGFGKTRLAAELRKYVLTNHGFCLWCQAVESEVHRPFSTLREAIGQFVRYAESLSPRHQREVRMRVQAAIGNFGKELLKSIPEIEGLLSGAPPETVALDPEREFQRATKTILNLLLALSGPRLPVLVVFDDYHWADRGTRDLIDKLSGLLSETNMLVVCTANRSFSSPEAESEALGLESAKGETDLVHVQLSPLSFDASRQLFEAGLRLEQGIVQHLARSAFQRFGGNPRLLIDAVKDVREEVEDLRSRENAEIGLTQIDTLLPEANTKDFIGRRLKRLSSFTRELLGVAAVVGRKFSLSVLGSVMGTSLTRVAEAVEEASRFQIVSRWALLDEDGAYFSNEPIHEDVYSSVPEAERRVLHRQIAEILECRASDDESVYDIAFHYLRGDDDDRAREASLRAAWAAKKAYANREASQFFSEALVLLPKGQEDLEFEITENLGDVCALSGQYDNASLCYQSCLEFVDDSNYKARLEGKLGDIYFRRGDNKRAISHLTNALSWLGLRPSRTRLGLWSSILFQVGRQIIHGILPRRLLTWKNQKILEVAKPAIPIFHTLAYAYYFLDQNRTLEVHLRQLNLAERLGPSKELGLTYSAHGVVCSIIPLHQRAIRYQRAGLKIREELDDRWGIGQSHAFLGVCSYYRSDLTLAIEYLNKGIRILESMGDQWEIEAAYSHLGFCHLLLGELDAAESTNRTLEKLSKEISDIKFIAIAAYSLAEVYLMRGDFERALGYVKKALDAGGDHFTQVITLRVKGQILLRLGNTEEALEVLEESLAQIRKYNLKSEYLVPNYLALAETYLRDAAAVGSSDRVQERILVRKARQCLATGYRLARRFENYLGYAHRVRAMYCSFTGSPYRAEKEFARSKRVLSSKRMIYQLGLTLLESSRWRSRDGTLEDQGDVDRAIEIFRKVGARVELDEARELLGLQKATADVQQQKLRNEHRQLTSLFKMSRTISSILDLDRLVVQITDLAVEVTGGERGYLFLTWPDDKLEIRCARGFGRKDVSCNLSDEKYGIVSQTFESGEPQVASLREARGEVAEGTSTGSSVICVPLRVGDKTFGLIFVENRLTQDLYSENDLEFITAFASQAATSLRNAFLYQESEDLNLRLEQKVRERTQELLKSKKEIETANRLKSEFLANMSHELRTPFNAIIAMSEILAEKTFGDLTEKQEVYVQQILDSAVHLLALINDVLDLSKVEAGQLDLDVDLFNINDLLRASLVIVKERAAKHAITIELYLDADVEIIRGDARRIKQVVFNLLSNAVKFTDDGGTVTVRSIAEGKDSVVVCVEDTGIGISEEDQKYIFDEFRQADSSYSRRYEGTGLGLALTRKFVEMHRGSIWVESEEKKGSRFSFRLPVSFSPDDADGSMLELSRGGAR